MTTRTTPGAVSAESWEQAVEEACSSHQHPEWIKRRAREIESTRTPATQTNGDADDVIHKACDAYESECGFEVSFFGMKAALSAAHHARKPKEK